MSLSLSMGYSAMAANSARFGVIKSDWQSCRDQRSQALRLRDRYRFNHKRQLGVLGNLGRSNQRGGRQIGITYQTGR
jgi:hypothetical protein